MAYAVQIQAVSVHRLELDAHADLLQLDDNSRLQSSFPTVEAVGNDIAFSLLRGLPRPAA
eukprot:14173431-Ditylum_brightwellii.AAC.1